MGRCSGCGGTERDGKGKGRMKEMEEGEDIILALNHLHLKPTRLISATVLLVGLALIMG